MTTPIAQNQNETAARKELPPVEHDAAPAAANDALYDQSRVAMPKPETQHEASNDPNNQPGKLAKSVAHWIHKHPEAHKHGVGFGVYQFARSALASAPYGFSMAGVLAGFTKMESVGAKLAESKTASAFTQGFGRGLKGFAGFAPAKWSALIGASFTFYRGTSKLGKWMTEYLFNPKDTEGRTAEKVSDLPDEAWRKIKEIAPAESSSTPISAIVLGFIVSAFKKPEVKDLKATIGGVERSFDWTHANFKSVPGVINKIKVMGYSIAHPSAKFIPQAAINTFGYALFFELGDRLFKDVQIRRGVWPGEHNSIKALKAAPDEYEQGIKDGNEATNQPKYADSAMEPVKDKNHYAFFTSEPNLGRFVFRRLLPTAVGITAYTAVKMRWASMFGNNFTYDKGISFKEFGKKSLGEGLATSLFFLIPLVSEPWEKAYDKFWDKKEKTAQIKDIQRQIQEKKLTPEQEKNYQELLARVTAKDREAANDGQIRQRA